MNEDANKAYYFCKGVVKAIAEIFIIYLILFCAVRIIDNCSGWNTDDSDKNGWNRSGLKVHTDYKTGIQYLSDGSGGLIERKLPKCEIKP
jgi:hypothetical protein